MTAITQQMIVSTGRKSAISVESLEDAVKICGEIRDTADYGSGIGATKYYGMQIGHVYVGNTKVAQIHYNGSIEKV